MHSIKNFIHQYFPLNYLVWLTYLSNVAIDIIRSKSERTRLSRLEPKPNLKRWQPKLIQPKIDQSQTWINKALTIDVQTNVPQTEVLNYIQPGRNPYTQIDSCSDRRQFMSESHLHDWFALLIVANFVEGKTIFVHFLPELYWKSFTYAMPILKGIFLARFRNHWKLFAIKLIRLYQGSISMSHQSCLRKFYFLKRILSSMFFLSNKLS